MKRLRELIPGVHDSNLTDLSDFSEKMLLKIDWKDRLHLSERGDIGFAAPGGEFTRAVYEFARSQARDLGPVSLKGQTVIELGAGMSAYGYLLANLLGAKAYVGIEAFYADCLLKSITFEQKRDKTLRYIPFSLVSDDMLTTLERIPDCSVSVFAFGIEECILGGSAQRLNIEREIERVLHEKGTFLSLRSDLSVKGIARHFNVNRKRFSERASLVLRNLE